MTIDLPDELCRRIIPLLEQCGQYLGNNGCNDFPVPDGPAARELRDEMEAWNLGRSVAEHRQSPDYELPILSRDGEIYLMDFMVLDYFTHMIARQVEAMEGVR